jgi:hypothetical protein
MVVHGFPVDEPAFFPGFSTQEDIFRDGEVVDEVQFLIDDTDSGIEHRFDAELLHHAAPELDFAFIGLVEPREYLHQGGFPCPVFPYQRMNLTFLEIEAHVVQGFDTGKLFTDSGHFQYCRHRVPNLQKGRQEYAPPAPILLRQRPMSSSTFL